MVRVVCAESTMLLDGSAQTCLSNMWLARDNFLLGKRKSHALTG